MAKKYQVFFMVMQNSCRRKRREFTLSPLESLVPDLPGILDQNHSDYIDEIAFDLALEYQRAKVELSSFLDRLYGKEQHEQQKDRFFNRRVR